MEFGDRIRNGTSIWRSGTGWDADVPISRYVFEVAIESSACYSNLAPLPAVSNLRATNVGRADSDNSSTSTPPSVPPSIPPSLYPRPLQVLSSIVRYVRLHPLTDAVMDSIGGVRYRSGLSPSPSPTRKKANTFNAPSFLLIVTVKPIFAFWLF